jgi:hypothetical protein
MLGIRFLTPGMFVDETISALHVPSLSQTVVRNEEVKVRKGEQAGR